MLGRGLESLIPSSSGAPSSRAAKEEATSAPPPQQSPPAPPADEVAREEKTEQKAESRGAERPAESHHAIFQIEVAKIKPNPHQPRRDFNDEALKELADSIREFGILQPLVVRKIEMEVPTGTKVEYELIAGERRLLAAKLLGLPRVPAIIRRVEHLRERLEMAIIENLQREDLNPIEVARGFAKLQDEFRMTQREIASRIGKSRETVANTVRLLDLPSDIQEAIAKGELSESHGRLLLALTEPQAQRQLFEDIRRNNLTTREVKRRVYAAKGRGAKEHAESALRPELAALEEKLKSVLGAPVRIEQKGDLPAGKISIAFYSEEELKNIVERLGGEGSD
jgi:ParB family chromosome partitioning protein